MTDRTLPEYIRVCPLCEGTGRYGIQRPCQICGKHTHYGRPGPGYVYRATNEPVGQSVLEQIKSLEKEDD